MNTDSTTKRCCKCKEDKLKTEFSRNSKSSDLLQDACKSCAKLYRDKIIANDPDYFSNALKKHVANNPKPKKLYFRDIPYIKGTDEYKIAMKARRSEQNKKAHKKYSSKPDVSERIKLYRQNPVYKKRQALRYREKSDLLNNDPNFISRRRENYRKWYEANKDHAKAKWHSRRARVKGNGGAHTKEDIADIFNMQSGKCAICKKSIKRKKHIDHIVPISKGGTNDRKNIQLLCPTCNIRKKDSDPIEFMQSQGFLL